VSLPRLGGAWKIFRPAALVLAFVVCSASRREALAGEDSRYALGPEARGPILAALDRMRPALVFADGGIERDHVLVRLCTRAHPPEHCFRLRLEHPSSDCGAARWGQFCARFPDGDPPPPMVAAIAAALRGTENAAIWTDLEGSVGSGSAAWSARALSTALALLLGPLAIGYIFGLAWRRRVGSEQGALFTLGAIAIPTSLALGFEAQLTLIGMWDALLVGLLAATGLVFAAHHRRPDWKALSLFLASLVGSLFVAEIACRAFLPPPPAFPGRAPTLRMATAVQQSSWFSMACASIYGDQPPPETFAPVYPGSWHPRPGVVRHVLHLGDSMVQGSKADGRFTDDLDRLEPDVEHVNAAIGGSGPDVYLSILRRFLTRNDVDAVVMHLTPNDYDDVDRPYYPCSDWKPLLVYGPSGTGLRFTEPRPYGREAQLVAWQQSPPPFVLRACVHFSSLAAHLAAAIVDIQQRVAARSTVRSDAERRAHVTAIMRDVVAELRVRDVPLVVNVFRDRAGVERNLIPESAPEDTMRQIAETLGVVVLDTWEPLVAAVRSGVSPFTNQAGPTDSHFNADGHALIARWLHRELPAAIERARVLAASEPAA
jgi:hypothetical protein